MKFNIRPLALKIITGLFLFFLITGMVLPSHSQMGWFAGYCVGLLAIALHYATSTYSKKWDNGQFFLYYLSLMFLRLLIVLGIFIGLLIMEIFDQFSFTVSFLISYICHSVINIFLINKELTNRSG